MNEQIQEIRYQVGEAWKGTYNAATSYGNAAVVQDPTGLSVYRSLKPGNTGHPLTDSAWWFCIIDLSSIKSESDRIKALNDAIANDEALRKAAEELRQQKEQQRIAAENQRNEAEQQRISAEQNRVNKESQRESKEQQRITAEQGRVSAESARVTAEQARVLAETLRANAEDQRAANEQNRVAAEQQRIERAEQDHQRAESDHAAYIDSLGAFDVSSYHATDGVLAKYADLTDAIGIGGANIPDTLRKGGMSVKFVQSSDNNYVQYRLMHPLDNASTAAVDFANTANWQGVDNEPTAGSKNLVESWGVAKHEGVIDTITPIVFTNNKRYSTGGEQINIESDIVSTEAWRCAAVDCNEGDAFSLSGQAGGDAAALCTFIASDGTVLKRDAILGLVKNHFSVAPANAAKCLINDIKTGQPCYKGRTIMALIENLLYIMPNKADDDEVVKIVNQALTSDQKNQVLSNLGIIDFVNDTPSAINSLQTGLSTVQSDVTAIEKIVTQYSYVNDNTSGSSSKTVGPYEYSTNIPVGTLMEVCLSDVITNENADGYIQFQLFNGDTRILNKNFMTSDGTLVNGSTYITAEQQVSKIVVKGVSRAGTSIQLNVSVTTGELIKDRNEAQQLRNDIDNEISALGQWCLKVYPDLVTTANISSVLSDANNATDNTIYFILSRTAPSHFPDYYPASNAPCIILETKTSGAIKIQSIRDLYTNDCLWERQYANSSWGEWISVCHKISVNKSVTTNKWTYSSLYDALSFAKHHRNTEIVVEPGTYDLIQEMGSDITGQNLGILLNAGMKIYCKQNVFVTCHYTGDDDAVMENFSAFMTGEGDWEIDGLNLSCSKVRYCIHDDMGQSPYPYKHILKNCKFHLDNSQSTWRAKQCIGGGLGKNGMVIIQNCVFESNGVDTTTHDDVNSEVSYHNSSVADAQSTVRLSECYFVNSSVSFGYYGASTKITEAIVNGCSCKWTPLVRQQSSSYSNENIELKQWNNEIRQ